MKNLKRWLSMLLVCCLVAGLLPLSTAAAAETASGTCGDNLTWVLDEDGTLTISGTGSMAVYSSSSVPWDSCQASITNVVIESGVTSIGDSAFRGYSSLTSISIPDSMTSIGDGAFSGCSSLTGIAIPDGVTSIGDGAFSGCSSLTGIAIPDGVTSIGDGAFEDCTSLTGITIPDSVTSIGSYTFDHCSSLTGITIPDGVTSIGDGAFKGCTSLTDVAIPDSVTSIGSYTFDHCSSLTNISIPDSVTSIGGSAFDHCTSLASVSIGNSVTNIDHHAFRGCSSLTGITIPDGVTNIGEGAFYFCSSLTGITIPDGVTSIGDDAFYGCSSLASVTIGNSVTSIGDGAFDGCSSLTGITIPDGVTSIGSSAFYGCSSLTNITIPDSVTSIGGDAFYGCSSLTNITIPDSVTSIGYSAFEDCTSLTNINIPDSVTSIGYSAFEGCTSLTSVAIPDSVTSIGSYTFDHCTSLASVSIGNSVTNIDHHAFYGCSSLTGITIPDGVTSIGGDAFYGCTSLASVSIGNSVTNIDDHAFYGCTSLTSVTIPDSVISIDYRAFAGCTSLTDVYYSGAEEEWFVISIGSDNDPLTDATIHYNSTGPDDGGDGENDETKEDGLTLSFIDGYQIFRGDTFDVSVSFEDGSYTDNDFTWSSSDDSVVSVSPAGISTLISGGGKANAVLTANKRGTAVITVDVSDGRSASGTVEVVVKPNSVTLPAAKAMILEDGEESLFAAVELYTLIVDLESGEKEAVRFTSSNSNVVALGDSHESSVIIPIDSISDDVLSIPVTLYPLSEGDVVITCELVLSGESARIPIKVRTRDRLIMERELNSFVANYNNYISALESALRTEASASVGIQNLDKCAADLRKRLKDYGIEFEPTTYGGITADEEIYICKAILKMLAEDVSNNPSFSDIEFKDITSVPVQIVQTVASGIYSESFRYTEGAVAVDISFSSYSSYLGSGSSAKLGTIKYSDASSGRVVSAYLCSTQDAIEKVISDYSTSLLNLEAAVTAYAAKEAYKDLKKALFGKDISIMKEALKSQIASVISENEDILKKTGFNDVMKTLNDCWNFYSWGKNLVDNLNTIDYTDLDTVKNIEFKSDSVEDNLAKLAMEGIESARKNILALLIDEELGGLDNKLAKIFFGCPVDIEIYNESKTQVGFISENEIWYDDDYIVASRNGDTKIVEAYNGALSFKITGTDYGTLSCTFEEYKDGREIGRVNYYDIPLYDGKQILASTPASDFNQNTVKVTFADTVIQANESLDAADYSNAAIQIDCDASKGGVVYGAGSYVPGDAVKLSAMSESGYTFSGWYDSDGNLLSIGRVYEIVAQEDTALTALFSETSTDDAPLYAITLNPCGGTCSNTSLITQEDGTLRFLPTPTRSGYSFDGWYTTANSGERVTTATVFDEDTTIYAHWSSASSGSGSSSSTSAAYAISVPAVKNGFVSVNPGIAAKGNAVTITVKADSGYDLYTLTVTDANGDTVKLTKKSDTQYTFTMPASKVTVEASFTEIEKQSTVSFVDVSTSAYYYNAVAWAVENGVTSGTSATTFSPDAACTRAQAVTFLWRAAGSPAPKSSVNPFADVPASAYYYDAVLWAVEQGITAGTSATTFSPNTTCTRAQIVTFLYRTDGTATAGNNPFTDVADSAYYADAVKWAVAEGVTAGTSATTFSPDASCTRGQIVTFLYRAYA